MDDPAVTGAFFSGMPLCRPGAFGATEQGEFGTCATNYQDIQRDFFSGTLTFCCGCAHPKMIGCIVLEKSEGPPAVVNTILSRFALLPTFIVYDRGRGALRSALGKLAFFVARVTIVSDLFHIVNHLCSDALHPRSYTGLEGVNTVAHEQRKAPINLMRRTLRSCGQDEYLSVLQLENVCYNVMARARSTSRDRLPEEYKYRRFYFSRNPCCCGCGYSPAEPELQPVFQRPEFDNAEVVSDQEWGLDGVW